MLLLTVNLCGCGILSQETMQAIASIGFDFQCQVMAATIPLPEGVPTELTVVQSDSGRFSPDDHPLRDVAVGTVIDDLSGLDGCWGRHYYDSYVDHATGETIAIERWEVLRFDLARGQLIEHGLRPPMPGNVPEYMGDAFITDLPFFTTWEYTATVLADNMVLLEYVDGEGAAIRDDGALEFYCPVSGGAFNLGPGSTLTGLVTLDGDYMKYRDTLAEPEEVDPAEYEESAGLWVRFDCPSE
jgi:hypothetical protein